MIGKNDRKIIENSTKKETKKETKNKMKILGAGKIKADPVLTAAWALALISSFIVHPDRAYVGYIDWRSLGILWSLMVIIQGFKSKGVFDRIGEGLLEKVKKGWQLAAVLVFLCFFGSMLITNDVALLTFVPFAILVLENCGRRDLLVPVIVLQTVAANLGSMLTPIGNPQNLYLYGLSGMGIGEFVAYMLPYAAASGGLLMIGLLFLPEKNRAVHREGQAKQAEQAGLGRPGEQVTVTGVRVWIGIYTVLFSAAILTVLRVLPWYVLVLSVLGIVGIMERKILARADYLLLLTFVGFFIFTGNMARIPAVGSALRSLVEGREMAVAVVASQCISNVPAALLLSGFTQDYGDLLLGVNIGGLGTLIASMASLISYKAYTNTYQEGRGRYLKVFTAVNLMSLVVLTGLYVIL